MATPSNPFGAALARANAKFLPASKSASRGAATRGGTPPLTSSLRPGPAPSHSNGPAAPAATPVPAATPAAPFLTPAQQAAWNKYQTDYGNKTAQINQALGVALTKFNTGIQGAQHTHDVNSDNANQSLAARGLFESSIRAGVLNDLDATLALHKNALQTAYATTTFNLNSNLTSLNSDYGGMQNYYNQLAAGNAAAQQPVMPSPTATPGPPAPSGSPGAQPPSSSGGAQRGGTPPGTIPTYPTTGLPKGPSGSTSSGTGGSSGGYGTGTMSGGG